MQTETAVDTNYKIKLPKVEDDIAEKKTDGGAKELTYGGGFIWKEGCEKMLVVNRKRTTIQTDPSKIFRYSSEDLVEDARRLAEEKARVEAAAAETIRREKEIREMEERFTQRQREFETLEKQQQLAMEKIQTEIQTAKRKLSEDSADGSIGLSPISSPSPSRKMSDDDSMGVDDEDR